MEEVKPKPKKDRSIASAVAEEVLGWKLRQCSFEMFAHADGTPTWCVPDKTSDQTMLNNIVEGQVWSPLEYDEHLNMVVDSMNDRGFSLELTQLGDKGWFARFSPHASEEDREHWQDSVKPVQSPDRRQAVCNAALAVVRLIQQAPIESVSGI